MKKYITLETKEFTIQGRIKLYKKDDIVYENLYTKNFKKSFKEIGKEDGYNKALATPIFKENEVKIIEKIKPRVSKKVKKEKIEEVDSLDDIEKYDVSIVTDEVNKNGKN